MDKHHGGSGTFHSMDIMGEDESSEISSYGSAFYITPEVNRVLSNVSRGSEVKVTFATAPEDVDLDKLFGFPRAEKLADTFKPEPKDEPLQETDVVPWRIFINHVDSFFGRYLVKCLSTKKFSFPKEDGDETSSVEEKSSEDETDDGQEETLSEEEEEMEGGEENLGGSQDQLIDTMRIAEDMAEDEDKEEDFFWDYDEDPFACLADEESEKSDEEIELVDKLFPVKRSDVDLHHTLTAEEVGKIDLRKLKPEEYFELLDIDNEEARIRYLSAIVHKKERSKLRKHFEKIEMRRLKDAQKKIKYSQTHKPFEIYGTLHKNIPIEEKEDVKFKYLDHVHIIEDMSKDRDSFLDLIMSCGTVIFNLTPCRTNVSTQASWTIQAMLRRLQDKELEDREAFRKSLAMRTFLLISPMLTWTNSVQLEIEGSSDLTEMAFMESDFRRRNPHDHFIKIYRAENETLNCGQKYRKRLKTLVINTGVLYGHEEEVLDFLFLQTWKSETDTPMFTSGENLIPLIHVDSLVGILYKIIRRAPFIKPPLIFVMERKCLTLQEICQTVSTLGNGGVMKIKKDVPLILPPPGIDELIYDHLTTHLNVTPNYLIEKLDNQFNDSFYDSGAFIQQQYIEDNRLKPKRILIDGPPLSGKTRLAMKLCHHYNIHYLTHDTIITLYKDLLTVRERDLKTKIREKSTEETSQEGEQNEEDNESPENEELKIIQNKIAELKRVLYEANGNITDEAIIMSILAELFTFKRITNIGFLLDGWPNTYERIKEIFDTKLSMAPNVFIKLDLEDKICLERIYNVSESYLKKNPVDETVLVDNMFAYKNRNLEGMSTIETFFQESEIDVKIINVNANEEINVFHIFHALGKPRDQKFWINIIGLDKSELQDDSAPTETKSEPEDEQEIRKKKLEVFAEEQILLQRKAKQDEEKIFALYAYRLQKYAQRHLMPTLCKGLLESTRVQPTNPIDFLAEYLFRNNPDGKLMTELQQKKFGREHTTVSNDEGFQQLQEMIAKKYLSKPAKY
ncbi:hypothetical protein WDU94_014800 [Cyamophila willieti]